MTSALGQDKAQNILSQVLEKLDEHNGVEALQWMAPKAVKLKCSLRNTHKSRRQ